jgi:NTE family protein
VALTISGGGFRATLAGLGVIRLLASAGLLGELRFLSSVSGGSLTNAVAATRWPQLRERDFSVDAVDDLLVEPLVSRISTHSLKWALIQRAWRTLGPMTRTELLADLFDQWFLNGVQLEQLDPDVRWIISAGNLVTGVRFTFERDVIGDYTIGLASTAGTGLRLSTAVASSAAVPGAFAAMRIEGISFPCATQPPVLLDGGTYDNTGLEALDSDQYRDTFLVTLNAGGLLHPGSYGRIPVIRDLSRANSLLYRQSTTLRTRAMVDRFRRGAESGDGPLPQGARRGVLFGLATTFSERDRRVGSLDMWQQTFSEVRTFDGKELALVPTVFDRLEVGLCRALIYRGWWLAGACLARYFPDYLGDPSGWLPPEL